MFFVIVDSILGFLRREPVKCITIFYRPRPKKIPFFSSCGLDKIPGKEYIISLFTWIKKMGIAGSSATHTSYRSVKTGSTFAVTQQKI
jgi:hypothetical protein